MNKEEKEAIERLNRKLTSEKFTKNIGMPVYIKDVELVLNLIEKQSKEIEALIQENKELKEKNKNSISIEKIEEVLENSVSSYDCLKENIQSLLYGEDCHR